MTKLMQWLTLGVIFLSIWLPLATNQFNNNFLQQYSDFILFFPFISIGLFGIYALLMVFWRVFTFNNCVDAAEELRCQINEARKDLLHKGFVFKQKA